MGLFDGFLGKKYPVMGDESIMAIKAHGTSNTPVQENLRWECSREEARRIGNFNRRYAEYAGYWEKETSFLAEMNIFTNGAPRLGSDGPPQQVSFYDSNSGRLLFTAPRGRSWRDFASESQTHGWPSFRDEEVRRASAEFHRCIPSARE